MAWLRDPDEIYRRSFAIVAEQADLFAVPDDMRDVSIRLVHACGMPDIVADLRWSDGAAAAARDALASGAPVICDAQMVADGVIAARLPADNQILSMIQLPKVAKMAKELGRRVRRHRSNFGNRFCRAALSQSATRRRRCFGCWKSSPKTCRACLRRY